jgi:hypothetical protein
MDKFLNFYTKYPWVSLIIITQWIITGIIVVYAREIDVTKIMGVMFLCTIIYAYFGFKVTKT